MDNILIIGGDRRQKELNCIFNKIGYRSTHILSEEDFNFAKTEINDVVIFPIPMTKDGEYIYSDESNKSIGINNILKGLTSDKLVFGGGFTDAIRLYFEEKKITYIDYLKCNDFVEYNAYLTGVGSLKHLYEVTNEDIRYKKVLVTGFGRVARYVAKSLKDAGCDVYITARNKMQKTEAECIGYKIIEFSKKNSFLYLFDYIFNTVPENIFTHDDVNHINGLYFELASAPYGVKNISFVSREEKFISASSLPGKYLSYSAAEKIAEITFNYLKLRNGGD